MTNRRRRAKGVGLAACCMVAALLLSGCGRPGERLGAPGTPLDQERDFANLYRRACSGCHGENGTLGPAPPLADALFQAIISDADLAGIIAYGRPETLMPGFGVETGGPLSDHQIQILIRGMRESWGRLKAADRASLPSYAAARPATDADVAAGSKVFASACAGCHGQEGKGGDRAGAIHDSVFLSLTSEQLIRRIVITGRPDLEMPDYRRQRQTPPDKPLTAEEIAQVTAYVQSWRPRFASEPKLERAPMPRKAP